MKSKVSSNLLKWYECNKRDLPWRKTRDPYRIWGAEVMLQQTQVARVIEYYDRFFKRFPTIQSLAQASWEEFLPFWQGLGFYSRGKNMLKTAAIIVNEFGGVFPKDRKTLEALPGIASYTSAAILSFAFGEPVPALDTNLRRVFQRLWGCTEKGVESRANALFQELQSCTSAGSSDASDLNHAIMDVGATICQSRKVQCETCPLQKECHFLQSGKKEEWETQLFSAPKKKFYSNKIPMEVAVACIHQNGKYLIAKRTKAKGGFWEFPGGKREKGEDWRHCLQREIHEELGIKISVRPHFFEEVWEEKEYLWRLRFSRCQILSGVPRCLEHEEFKWVFPSELKKYDFPKANQKAIERLVKMKMEQ